MASVKPESLSQPAHTRRQLRTQQFALTRRRFKETWQVLRHNRLALVGVILIVLFAIMAVLHPILMATVWPRSIYSPDVGFDLNLLHPALPGEGHILGTDALGRDVLSLLLAAATPTFIVGITAAVTAVVIGAAMGAVSAYYRGAIDAAFTRLSDVALLLPAPLFMVIVGFRFREVMGPVQFGLIYGLLSGVSSVAIVMRAYALTVMARPFVAASKVAGAGARHIILKDLLPHMLPLATLYMMLTVVGAVVSDAFVSFFGVSRPHENWGTMIYSAFALSNALASGVQWHVLIPPALALSLFAAAFYLVARGVHEVADPRLRRL